MYSMTVVFCPVYAVVRHGVHLLTVYHVYVKTGMNRFEGYHVSSLSNAEWGRPVLYKSKILSYMWLVQASTGLSRYIGRENGFLEA